METSRLSRNEIVAMVGGALLAIGLFLAWYKTNPDNAAANIDGEKGSQSAFQVHPILRWLLLLGALAPFILTYIIVRGHELVGARRDDGGRGHRGARARLLQRHHRQARRADQQISLQIGWYLALVGSLLMLIGSALRSGEAGRARRPPGTF